MILKLDVETWNAFTFEVFSVKGACEFRSLISVSLETRIKNDFYAPILCFTGHTYG